MKNYKEKVKKLNGKLKTEIVTKGCQKGFIRQYRIEISTQDENLHIIRPLMSSTDCLNASSRD